MEKTPTEMAHEINQNIEALKTDLSKAVKKEDLAALEIKLNELSEKDTSETNKNSIEDLQEQLNVLKEKTITGEQIKKGSFVTFVEDNLEKNKDIANDRSYSASTTIKAPALMTTANVTGNVTDGFNPLFGNYVDASIGSTPKADPFILPLVNVISQPGTESIWYVDRVNEEGDAEFIGEGDLKPLIDAEWATSKTDVKEVAVRWKFTKRLMYHAPSIVADFREHANELIENKMDDGIVSGDGTGDNLAGLETLGSAFIAPTQLANYYSDANIFDVICAAATAVRLNNFKGDLTCILNTVWMAQMMGVKNSEGDYIVPPFASQDGRQIGETRIVFTNRLADDKIIIGDLKKFNVVMSENVLYDEGYENDDFSKNLVTRKLEAFLGTYIKASDAGAIIVDDISTIQSAIASIEP